MKYSSTSWWYLQYSFILALIKNSLSCVRQGLIKTKIMLNFLHLLLMGIIEAFAENLIFAFIIFVGASYWKVKSQINFWVDAWNLENFHQSFEIEKEDTIGGTYNRKKNSITMSSIPGNTVRNKKTERGRVAKTFKISSKQQIPIGLLNTAEVSPALLVKFVHQNSLWSALTCGLWVVR